MLRGATTPCKHPLKISGDKYAPTAGTTRNGLLLDRRKLIGQANGLREMPYLCRTTPHRHRRIAVSRWGRSAYRGDIRSSWTLVSQGGRECNKFGRNRQALTALGYGSRVHFRNVSMTNTPAAQVVHTAGNHQLLPCRIRLLISAAA